MAKTVVTTDDLDASTDASTVTFSFAGSAYEIDLSKKNTAVFEKVLRPYIAAARPAGSPRRRGPASGATRGRRNAGVDLAAVRAWAADNGHIVSDRGRIPKAVLEAYQAAR